MIDIQIGAGEKSFFYQHLFVISMTLSSYYLKSVFQRINYNNAESVENAPLLHHPLIPHLHHNILIMQVSINILDIITLCVPHDSFGYPVTNTFLRSKGSEAVAGSMEGHCLVNLQVRHYIFQIPIGRLIGYWQEYLLTRFAIAKQSHHYGRYNGNFISYTGFGALIA